MNLRQIAAPHARAIRASARDMPRTCCRGRSGSGVPRACTLLAAARMRAGRTRARCQDDPHAGRPQRHRRKLHARTQCAQAFPTCAFALRTRGDCHALGALACHMRSTTRPCVGGSHARSHAHIARTHERLLCRRLRSLAWPHIHMLQWPRAPTSRACSYSLCATRSPLSSRSATPHGCRRPEVSRTPQSSCAPLVCIASISYYPPLDACPPLSSSPACNRCVMWLRALVHSSCTGPGR
jgi:hypothetical protein